MPIQVLDVTIDSSTRTGVGDIIMQGLNMQSFVLLSLEGLPTHLTHPGGFRGQVRIFTSRNQ